MTASDEDWPEPGGDEPSGLGTGVTVLGIFLAAFAVGFAWQGAFAMAVATLALLVALVWGMVIAAVAIGVLGEVEG